MGHGGHWSDVLSHGIKLSVLHNHRRRIDHGCRHKTPEAQDSARRGGPNTTNSTNSASDTWRTGAVPELSEVWLPRTDWISGNSMIFSMTCNSGISSTSNKVSHVELRRLSENIDALPPGHYCRNFFNKLSPIRPEKKEDWRVLFDEILLRTHLDQHALHIVRSLIVPGIYSPPPAGGHRSQHGARVQL